VKQIEESTTAANADLDEQIAKLDARIAFAFKPGDLLFFDSRQHLHGNLPFTGERLSAIYYCAGLIAKWCGN
jgi:hypothetical protein